MQPQRRSLAFALFALAVLFAPASAGAYTLKETESGAHVRWSEPAIALELVMVEGSTLAPELVREALSSAAARWSAVPGAPALSVREGASTRWGNDGVNGVYVLARWPFEDRRLAVTVSSYDPYSGRLVDADILVNGGMAFEIATDACAPDRYDLGLVLTHELGHLLGLDESDVLGATMWPTMRMGELERRELAPDDVDAVLALYGAEPATTVATYGCAVGARAVARPSWMALASLLVGLALVGRRSGRGGKSDARR